MRYFVLMLISLLAFGGCSGDEAEECTPNHHTVCKEGVVYWVDSCGEQGDKAGDCECGCNADFTACKDPCDCIPDCTNKECGPDGCGGTCPPGCDSGYTCVGGACEEECQPDCTGKVCGADGCGGTCPPGCGPGQTCVDGACQGECQPDCIGKCCGDDKCGGECPDECAATGQTCNTQTCLCEGQCTPDCDGKDCGPDGCGGECGTCDPGYDCEEGACVCNYEECGQVCCAEGEVCQNNECCLPDCAGKQCGLDCAGESCGLCGQGYFCSDYLCIQAGVEDCWTGAQCPPASPYCLMSCRSMENKCCEVMPDHPRRIDGSIDDSCEVCCTNPDFTNPVLWPDGEPSCCATEAPYPYYACGSLERMCCPAVAENPRRCDGTTDDTCHACCSGTEYPVGVIYPDGQTSCCPQAHPWPCVQNGVSACCDDPGQCG